jgi:hypothetical protein
MMFAILCYDDEQAWGATPPDEVEAVMRGLDEVQEKLAAAGRLGPVAQLAPTRTARTVRKDKGAVVLDGPFAETKEQLLGFFLVDCETMEQAVEAATELGRASGLAGAYEVRPLQIYRPGVSAARR